MGGFDNPISANWLSMDYPESNESRRNCCVKVHVQVLSIGQSGPVGNGGQELRRQRTASEDSVEIDSAFRNNSARKKDQLARLKDEQAFTQEASCLT